MQQIQYIVVKSFKYDGRRYLPGDEFTPAGGKWDKQLVANQKFIRTEITNAEEATWQDDAVSLHRPG